MPPFCFSLKLYAQFDLYANPWEATLVAGTLEIFDRDLVLIDSFADYQNWGFEAFMSGSMRALRLHDVEENFTYGNTPLQFVIPEIKYKASDWKLVVVDGVDYRYYEIQYNEYLGRVHVRN